MNTIMQARVAVIATALRSWSGLPTGNELNAVTKKMVVFVGAVITTLPSMQAGKEH